MNDLTNPPGEQPVIDTSAPVAGEQPQSGDTSNAIKSLGLGDLTALLEASETGTLPNIPAAAPIATEPTEPPAGEQPTVATEPEAAAAEEPGSPKPPNRVSVRILPAEEQKLVADALNLVRENPSLSITDAIGQLAGKATPAAPPAPSEGITPPAPESSPATTPAAAEPSATPANVAEIESKIATLREQRDAASEDFNSVEVNRLTREIEDSLPLLVEARINAQRQQAEQVTYRDRYMSAVESVETKYPDLQDDTSRFSKLFNAVVIAARAGNDPRLSDPTHLMQFADELAADLKPASTVPTPAPAPPKGQSRPNGAAVVPGNSQVSRPTDDQVKAAIKNATLADLAAVICTE